MISSKPWVIVLNGVGSVGKTTTAKSLQQMASLAFLHLSMDGFIEMLPSRLLDHEDGMTFHVTERGGHRSIDVRSGIIMKRLLRGMRRAVAAMASEGNHLVVDDVMFDAGEADQYRRLLTGAELRFVGLFASLPVLERREKGRGDREIGLARGQYGVVHRGMTYDLELDTTGLTPPQCAEAICRGFDLSQVETC